MPNCWLGTVLADPHCSAERLKLTPNRCIEKDFAGKMIYILGPVKSTPKCEIRRAIRPFTVVESAILLVTHGGSNGCKMPYVQTGSCLRQDVANADSSYNSSLSSSTIIPSLFVGGSLS